MLLIDTLISSDQGNGRAITTFGSDSIAADDSGELTPIISIELMAQTYAAVKGWEITQAGKEFPVGYLVGVQKFENLGSGHINQELTIDVETVGEFEGFAVVEGTVSNAESTLARGKIKLWVPEEEA